MGIRLIYVIMHIFVEPVIEDVDSFLLRNVLPVNLNGFIIDRNNMSLAVEGVAVSQQNGKK